MAIVADTTVCLGTPSEAGRKCRSQGQPWVWPEPPPLKVEARVRAPGASSAHTCPPPPPGPEPASARRPSAAGRTGTPLGRTVPAGRTQSRRRRWLSLQRGTRNSERERQHQATGRTDLR